MGMIENFEALLAKGQDNAMLRYTLGIEYLKLGNTQSAIEHLQVALTHDSTYSAAWKALGKAQGEAGDYAEAIHAYNCGIEVAQARGDKQLVKEMTVFRRRMEKLAKP